MNVKKFLAILILVTTFLVSGCIPKNTSTGQTQTVKLGVIAPISGPAASIGEEQVRIYQDTVQEFNSGQNKYRVELIVEDGKCSGKDAVSAYQKLTSVDGVSIILGGSCSAETISAGEIAGTQDVVMLSALSSSPDVTKLNNVFRFRNDLDASRSMIEYFTKNNITAIALVYENTDYASAYANALKKQFTGKISTEQKFQSDEKDFGIIAKALKDVLADTQMIVIIPQNDTTFISLMKAFDAEGLSEQIKNKIIGADTLYSETIVQSLGALVEGVYSVQVADVTQINQKAKQAAEQYTQKYGSLQRPTFFPFTKEAIAVVLDGIRQGNITASQMRTFLQSINEQNARDGYVGRYYFDQEGDGKGIQFTVSQIRDGKLVPIE